MKIGLVFDDSLDRADGVTQYVLTLGKWLSRQKHDVHYLVGQTKRRDVPNVRSLSRNIAVSFNHNRLSIPLPVSRRRLRELLARERFDILHVQMPYSPALGARVIELADSRTAIVGTFHTMPASRLAVAGNRVLGKLLSRSLRRFDKVIVSTPGSIEFAKKMYGVDSCVIPLGLDLEPFAKAKPRSNLAQTRNIVFLGRLVERKGCAYLLKAIAQIAHRDEWPNNTRVIICGDGPQRRDLQEYVHHNGLSSIVTFEGFVSEADKPGYLAAGDVVVFPSTSGEAFGIVLIEALAAARGTVLGGNNSGYRAVLRDRPKQIFDPKNTAALADTLLSLLKSDSSRKRDLVWQRNFVRKLDIDVVGRQTLEVYRQALQNRKA